MKLAIKKSIMVLLFVICSMNAFCQESLKDQYRSVTLETIKSLYDPKYTNFYIKADDLYLEADLNSPHTLHDIHKVVDYDENLYNQAKDQAYQLFKKLEYIGILNEGNGGNFNCEFSYYYIIINYITTDGQLLSYKMYISRSDIEKNLNSFNRTDFLSDLKRIYSI